MMSTSRQNRRMTADEAPAQPATLKPQFAIPAVLTAAVIVGIVSSRGIGSKPIPAATPKAVSAAAISSGSVTLDALLGLSPQALLQALPDPGTKTAAAKEVARWRDTAKASPDQAKNWVNLGDALMQRSRELVDPHYYDYAHAAYTIALKLDPQNADAYTGMAWVCGGRHQFDKSIEYGQKALAINPASSSAYGLIGDAQVETGDYDSAYDSYQKMLDIRPDASSYSRGAHLLFLTGNARKAMLLMSQAVKVGGPYTENSAWCRAQLADMMWQSGNLVPAEIVIKDAVKIAPENYFVQTALGHILESKHDLKGAEAAYKKAIEISPQHAALVSLGDLYQSQGKTKEAEEMYTQVEATHAHHQQHGNHDEYYMAGFFADHDRQLDRAVKIVQSREPRSPLDQEIAAWVYYKNGNLPEAQKYIDAALQKGEPLAPRLFRAGMIYTKLSQRNKAEQLLSDALAKNPHFNILQAKIAASTLHDLGTRPPEGQMVAQQREKTSSGIAPNPGRSLAR